MIHLCIFVPHFKIKQSRIIYREELTELNTWNWNNDLKIHWCTLIIEFLESRIFWILKTFVTNVNVKWHQLNIFFIYFIIHYLYQCDFVFQLLLSACPCLVSRIDLPFLTFNLISSCFKFFTPNFRWEFSKLYINRLVCEVFHFLINNWCKWGMYKTG